LAKNPEIQRKLQDEIDEVLLTDSNTHEFNYEKIMSMKYLTACIDEALRKYPPVSVLNREASNDYQISDSKIVIEKGTPIVIPVYAIHNDPDYYPDPDDFIPERFLDGKSNGNGLPFWPFGDGPRNCIGRKIFV
jgi:cytochrome P450 family 6